MNAHAALQDPYRAFLEAKVARAAYEGFDVAIDDINPALKDFTRAMVQWGVKGGRRAYFASFGLHKTATQIETMRLVMERMDGAPTHITLPLGVRQEFLRDAQSLFHGRFAVRLKFIRSAREIERGVIHLSNYETMRDGKIAPEEFAGTSLDEASILRSFGSKTFQTFLPMFSKVPYRFVATATPSPNRYKELIHYAGYLGVMDTGEALTRFFERNPDKAGDLTLFPHKEEEFWLWLSSWAVFVQRPSDLGFSDEGYDLPPLDVRWHEVKVEIGDAGHDRDGQFLLMRDGARGLAQEARERREAIPSVIAKMKEIMAETRADHHIIWHDLEAERHAINAAVPSVTTVYGAQELEERERLVMAFSNGTVKDLAAKPVMFGSGCNFQRHCHHAISLGVAHKFNDFIQSIYRIQRFGQQHRCRLDIIYPETMRETRHDLEAKWGRHDAMMAHMSALIREHGLSQLQMAEKLTRAIGVKRREAAGAGWLLANNDCVEEMALIEADALDLIVTSIPFSNHYEYTPLYNDFGHTRNNDHFWAQMGFLSGELLRCLKPGRIAAIHVKDRVLFGAVTGAGAPTVSPFHAEAIMHYRACGFDYMGMITVVTDVVRENNGTYRLGYSEMLKDGTKMGVGSPEYVLLLRKPQSDRSKGYADDRVTKREADYSLARWQVDAHAFWRSSGDRLLTPAELMALSPQALPKAFAQWSLQDVYDYEAHVALGDALAAKDRLPKTYMGIAPASPHAEVWTDVNRMATLNANQVDANLEKHICPLQFDIVDRLIVRYSNEGDLVFDPFGGLGTVPYRALPLKRRGRAVELSATYFRDAARHLERQERGLSVPTLFGLSALEDGSAAA